MTIFGNVITELDTEALYVGSSLISCYFDKKNNVRFADSANIFKTSLDSIGKALGYEKGETPQSLIDGTFEGSVTEEIKKYCLRDCNILYMCLCDFFFEIGDITLTIASSAMKYFRRNYLKKPIYYDREKTNEFYNSYYGYWILKGG